MITSFPATDHQDHVDDLKYSLAKRVPDMSRGFAITTCYGEINIDPEHAALFRSLVARVLRKELEQLDRL